MPSPLPPNFDPDPLTVNPKPIPDPLSYRQGYARGYYRGREAGRNLGFLLGVASVIIGLAIVEIVRQANGLGSGFLPL